MLSDWISVILYNQRMTGFWRVIMMACIIFFIVSSCASMLILVMLNTQFRELAARVTTSHISTYTIKDQLFEFADYVICVVLLNIISMCIVVTIAFLQYTGIYFRMSETSTVAPFQVLETNEVASFQVSETSTVAPFRMSETNDVANMI